MEPAVFVDRFSRSVFSFPVAGHIHRATRTYLTDLTCWHLGAGQVLNAVLEFRQRQPHRPWLTHTVQRVHAHHRRGFRQPIPFREHRTKTFLELTNELNRRGRPSGEREPHVGEVVVALWRMNNRVPHRWDPGHHREFVVAHDLQLLNRVKSGQQRQLRSVRHRHHENGRQPKHVEQREGGATSVVFCHLRVDATNAGRVGQVAHREHGALWASCGARGVQQDRDVLTLAFDWGEVVKRGKFGEVSWCDQLAEFERDTRFFC